MFLQKNKLKYKTSERHKKNELDLKSNNWSVNSHKSDRKQLNSSRVKSSIVNSEITQLMNRRSSLYTPSDKREKLLSAQNWFKKKVQDPKIERRVQRIVMEKLKDPYADTANSEEEIDYDSLVNTHFNIDEYKHPHSVNSSIKNEQKVFINTMFDRSKIKEVDIPPEVLFNPKIDRIRMEEAHLNIKPRKNLFCFIIRSTSSDKMMSNKISICECNLTIYRPYSICH